MNKSIQEFNLFERKDIWPIIPRLGISWDGTGKTIKKVILVHSLFVHTEYSPVSLIVHRASKLSTRLNVSSFWETTVNKTIQCWNGAHRWMDWDQIVWQSLPMARSYNTMVFTRSAPLQALINTCSSKLDKRCHLRSMFQMRTTWLKPVSTL